jgi:hypothetical protein
MLLNGFITDVGQHYITIKAQADISYILDKQVKQCDIFLRDGRTINREQQKKAYALMRDISLWSGYTPDEVKELAKYDYIAKYGGEEFSLADCSVTVARCFIDYLVEFCLTHDIPCRDSLLELCEDVRRYLYLCLIHKRCCVCGKKTQLHHVDTVGMGYDRTEIPHIGKRAEALCFKHHRECHDIGQKDFDEKYHVFGIEIDNIIADKYRLKKGVKT